MHEADFHIRDNDIKNLFLRYCEVAAINFCRYEWIFIQLRNSNWQSGHGKLPQVHGVYIRSRRGIVCFLGVDDIGDLGGVECIPEQVASAVGAGRLKRKTCYLPVVPPHAAAALVDHIEPCCTGTKLRTRHLIRSSHS